MKKKTVHFSLSTQQLFNKLNFRKEQRVILSSPHAFTLIEIIITITIFSSLIGFAIINLLQIHKTESIQSTTQVLISDLRTQQTKAMSGNTQNSPNFEEYGIYFDTNRYILFKGSAYNPSSASNFEIPLSSNFIFTDISLANNQVVFEKGSGEMKDFSEGQNSVTIEDIDGLNSQVITINPYGVISSN